MTVTKTPIDPTRIRQLPIGGFSWINRRFIRGGYIRNQSNFRSQIFPKT